MGTRTVCGQIAELYGNQTLQGERPDPAPGSERFREGGRARGARGASDTEGDLSGVPLGPDTLPEKDLVLQGVHWKISPLAQAKVLSPKSQERWEQQAALTLAFPHARGKWSRC